MSDNKSEIYKDLTSYFKNILPKAKENEENKIDEEKLNMLKSIFASALASGGLTKALGGSNTGALLAASIGGAGSYGLNKFSSINKKASMRREMYVRICKDLGLNPNAPESYFKAMREGGIRSAIKRNANKVIDNKTEKSDIINNINKKIDKDKSNQLNFFDLLK